MSITHSPTSETINASAEIAEQIKAFLKSGGKINKIPTGVSADSDWDRRGENFRYSSKARRRGES